MIVGSVFLLLIIILGYVLFANKKPLYDDESEIYNHDIAPLEWDEGEPKSEPCRTI